MQNDPSRHSDELPRPMRLPTPIVGEHDDGSLIDLWRVLGRGGHT